MNDWVATAPTPASAQVTMEPTENQCDWTATPISPVAESRATIEEVATGRRSQMDWACSAVALASRSATMATDRLGMLTCQGGPLEYGGRRQVVPALHQQPSGRGDRSEVRIDQLARGMGQIAIIPGRGAIRQERDV